MEGGREKGRGKRERGERERGGEREAYLRFLRNLRKQCVHVYGQYLLN